MVHHLTIADMLDQRLAACVVAHEQKPEEVTNRDWEQCYRYVLLSALNRIPRNRMPTELLALSITVQATELLSRALFVACGDATTKGFVKEGIDDLLEWLHQCRFLFAYVADVSDMLPTGRRERTLHADCAHALGEIQYLVGQLQAALENSHGDPTDDVFADHHEEEECGPLMVHGRDFTNIAERLYGLVTEWLDDATSYTFMKRVASGSQELSCSRILINMTDGVIGQ